MDHSWLAYLPPHLAADLLAHPSSDPLDRVLSQQAITLFADISGFTPMSEALGQVGPHGTEELSRILNQVFGAMIMCISRAGGSIGKFAGDALTIVFPTPNIRRKVTMRRAIQCALDMQAIMIDQAELMTSAGPFRLSMKIGIGMGDLLTATVGDPAIRLEYLIAGNAIDRCANAEQHAPKGAVVISDELLPFAEVCDTQPLTAGFHQITSLHHRPQPPVPVSLPEPDAPMVSRLICYLPPTIAERLAQGHLDFANEHRRVTTMFVRFTGFDYQEAGVLEKLQHYLREVVQISDRYGGYLRQIDVGDKGSLFIVLFGAPITHEDDAERALRCALDLRTMAEAHGVVTATGITTGQIFCGFVGSAQRREYAAIGDSVNLAARLMSAAQPHQILVDLATPQQARAGFSWNPLAPITVKGKSTPIHVALLEQATRRSPTRLQAPGYSLPMVGRQQELATAQHCLSQVIGGQAQMLLIVGEAGMGKSRLIAEVLRYASHQPIMYYTSECRSYGQQSYLVWQNLLKALFDLSSETDEATQVAQVHTILQNINPQLLERAPLLGPLLDLSLPETPLSQSLEGRLRMEALQSLLVQCMEHWTKQRPLLLVMEDCHWIDEPSSELLLNIAQRSSNMALFLILSYRQLDPTATAYPFFTQLQRLVQAHTLQLAEFTLNETQELITLKLEQQFGAITQVPSLLYERISEKAQGNPFYIDELITLMYERGIDVHNTGALQAMTLPDSLQRLIISRIDQLEERPKTILKVASIIGRLFSAAWVWSIDTTLGDAHTIRQQLEILQQRDFTQVERSEPELEYLFKHILTREVAYQSLALSTRMVLHEQVGQFIEAQYTHELERYLDVLAYHYGHSANVPKQREYYWRAGQAAHTAFANSAAIHYYEQLLPLQAEEEMGTTLLALANVLKEIRHADTALIYANRARQLAERLGDKMLRARANDLRGNILHRLSRYDEALIALEEARAGFTNLRDQQGVISTVGILISVLSDQGRHAEALAEATDCLPLAEAIDNHGQLCTLLMIIGSIYVQRGQYTESIQAFERGIALATAHNLRGNLPGLTNNLAVVYIYLGKYPEAFVQAQHTLAQSLIIGAYYIKLLALINFGLIYQDVGQVTEGLQCLLTAITLMGDLPDPRLLGNCLTYTASCCSLRGERAFAEKLRTRTITIYRDYGMRYYLARELDWHAGHCLADGHIDEAATINTEALVLAQELGIATLAFNCRVRAIQLAVLHGQQPLPDALLELTTLQEERSSDLQSQVLVADIIWQLNPQNLMACQTAADQYRALYERIPKAHYRQRYTELTGEWLPPPPVLPAPPAIVETNTLDLDTLLQRVDRFLATMNQTS